MVLVSGSPQNAESRCVIEDTWSSIVSTEVLFSKNYLCLGRKNSKELHFPPYWHSSLGRKQSKCEMQGANHHPCPRLFQSAWTVAFPSPAHSRAEALPCWCKACDSRPWADPNIFPVSAGPFQSRFKLCFPKHTSPELRSCPQIPSSACGLASPRNPATIPNVSERHFFWMKKAIQFYPLCRSLYFW